MLLRSDRIISTKDLFEIMTPVAKNVANDITNMVNPSHGNNEANP